MAARPTRSEDDEQKLAEVDLYGHCDAGGPELTRVARESPRELTSFPGDFVVAVHRPESDLLVSSRSGLVNYFHSSRPTAAGSFAHGGDVATVLARGGGGAGWDHVAVADYLTIGHPLGTSTVAAGVQRVPPGALVTLPRDGAAPVLELVSPHQRQRAGGPDAAAAALCRAIARAGEDTALSISGGLDSRLLLAALLACGHRPRLLACGLKGSFDRELSEAIARRFGLVLDAHAVAASDVHAVAAEVALASNGVLPVSNAAGIAHLRALGDAAAGGPVLIGYLGEYARSSYADHSLPAALRGLARGRAGAGELIRRHGGCAFSAPELAMTAPQLAAALAPEAVASRLELALAALPGRNALDLSDEFFIGQHGPQKVGAELAAAGRFVDWRTPFGDASWVDAVRALPRRWKLGDRLHRRLIGELCPQLLGFADERYGSRTPSRPPLWALVRTPGPRGPCYLPQEIFRSGPLQRSAAACGTDLAGLIEPELARRIGREQAASGARPHALFALAALASWRRALRLLRVGVVSDGS